MIAFFLAALLLLAVSAFVLLRPLLIAAPPVAKNNRLRLETTRAILRDQLAELEREHQEGQLDAAAFGEARDELNRRILEEMAQAEAEALPVSLAAPPAAALPNRTTAIALFASVLFAAAFGYALLGNPTALDPTARQPVPTLNPDAAMTPEQIEAMVAQLAERMKANPNDAAGWIMLGKSYRHLQRPAEAAAAFAHAETQIATDPTLLVEYAEALAASSEEGFEGKPTQLIQDALRLTPEHGQALFLAGRAALESGDKKAAANYWEKLLPQAKPGSELHTLLTQRIAAFRAESAGGKENKKKGKSAKK
jgi:cytochrome c-type biogenesis protein CcmH